jgi:hypothetical protein
MQRNASIRIGTGSPILKVALDRTSKIRQLASDLMVTSCQQLDFHQTVPVCPAYLLIIESCQFGILSHGTGTADI